MGIKVLSEVPAEECGLTPLKDWGFSLVSGELVTVLWKSIIEMVGDLSGETREWIGMVYWTIVALFGVVALENH